MLPLPGIRRPGLSFGTSATIASVVIKLVSGRRDTSPPTRKQSYLEVYLRSKEKDGTPNEEMVYETRVETLKYSTTRTSWSGF
jgi:hypothetical protein